VGQVTESGQAFADRPCNFDDDDQPSRVMGWSSPMLTLSGRRKNRVIHSSTTIPMPNQIVP